MGIPMVKIHRIRTLFLKTYPRCSGTKDGHNHLFVLGLSENLYSLAGLWSFRDTKPIFWYQHLWRHAVLHRAPNPLQHGWLGVPRCWSNHMANGRWVCRGRFPRSQDRWAKTSCLVGRNVPGVWPGCLFARMFFGLGIPTSKPGRHGESQKQGRTHEHTELRWRKRPKIPLSSPG